LFLFSEANKVRLEFDLKINDEEKIKLNKLFISKFKPAMDIYSADNDISSKSLQKEKK
jgi:hypothetical protein